ncbi:MAG: hypothetical protein V9G13_03640 [Marmoricola sp.]
MSRWGSTPTSVRCRSHNSWRQGSGVALGSDDPLLFGARLASQYATMRAAHELTDSQLADLAKSSIHGSTASESDKVGLAASDRPMAGR